jgi:hypothetical protein
MSLHPSSAQQRRQTHPPFRQEDDRKRSKTPNLEPVRFQVPHSRSVRVLRRY